MRPGEWGFVHGRECVLVIFTSKQQWFDWLWDLSHASMTKGLNDQLKPLGVFVVTLLGSLCSLNLGSTWWTSLSPLQIKLNVWFDWRQTSRVFFYKVLFDSALWVSGWHLRDWCTYLQPAGPFAFELWPALPESVKAKKRTECYIFIY